MEAQGIYIYTFIRIGSFCIQLQVLFLMKPQSPEYVSVRPTVSATSGGLPHHQRCGGERSTDAGD